MQVTSVFEDGENIPQKYTCDGQDINPRITVKEVPDRTRSLALVIDDPDAPGQVFDHWVVWNIAPETRTVEEDSVPGTQGMNDFGKHEYGGPCPPDGEHRYRFKVYALNTKLDLSENTTKDELQQAMQTHIIEQDTLIGTYDR